MVIEFFVTFVVIFLLESILSIDNSAVLAICVNRLPDEKQRKKALLYGIWGAYLFRGLSLFAISWLMANPEIGNIFKIFGGLYLLRLAYTHFTPTKDSTEEGDLNYVERFLKALSITLPLFWLVVIEVEVLDFVFSIDNLFAVTAMTDNIYVIFAAVGLAILSMRFVTQKMSKLMEVYPYLETRAYIVILLIGLKLVLNGGFSFTNFESIKHILEAEWFDMAFSILGMLLFLPFGQRNTTDIK